MLPNSARRSFCRMLPVCSAENTSDEKAASTQSHSSVGIHASSLRENEAGTGPGTAVDDKSPCLFQPVIGGFTRDDHVMHVVFAQACAADANEPRLLLQLRNVPGAAVSHAGTKP